jgi:predicted nucleotidyltransferase
MTEIEPKAPTTPTISGLPQDATARILERLTEWPAIQRVVLYGSRALGRQRSGSDIDLCLDAPDMDLAALMVLGAQLDDLLLPWRIDLQLRHLIRHPGLLEHIDRVGITIG